MRRWIQMCLWRRDSLSGHGSDSLSEGCNSRGVFIYYGGSGRLSSRGFHKKYSRTGKYSALFAMSGQRR